MKLVDEAAYRRAPTGALVLGRGYAYGSPDGVLRFSIVSGDVDEDSARELVRL